MRSDMRRSAALVLLLCFAVARSLPVEDDAATSLHSGDDEPTTYIWPMPMSYEHGKTTAAVAPGAFWPKSGVNTLAVAYERYQRLTFPHESVDVPALTNTITAVTVTVDDDDESHPQLDTDESYTLKVPVSGSCTISAKTVYGAMHALETLSQLVEFDFDTETYFISQLPITIIDKPRFKHRGLMIDSARHFETLASIRTVIESLPYAKINVLHWHIVDAQSFPFQFHAYPAIWKGAYSQYEKFTQRDIQDIVEFARLHGVRVIVEFDMPGHADSWCVGVPSLCPSTTCTTPLNVASNVTFKLIDALLGECSGRQRSAKDHPSGIFPDDYIHLGGDEVNTHCWETSAEISSWLADRNMTADDGYAYFVKQTAAIAMSQGRSPIQWSEVYDHFGTHLPKDIVIHVWKSNTDVNEVVENGYKVLVNVGYFNESWYLDNLNINWTAIYVNDPCRGIADSICATNVLGGQGEMWGETVDTSDIGQTVWPRLAAIAERLWSPKALTSSVEAALPRIEYFRCLLNRRGVRAAPVNNPNARSAPSGPGSCLKQ